MSNSKRIARQSKIAYRVRVALILALTGSIIVGFGYRIEQLSYRAFLRDIEISATMELIEVREAIQNEVFDHILQMQEIATNIGSNPNLSQQTFATLAQSLLARNPDIISVGAAPDLIVTLVHPMAGNESTLGLDYRNNTAQLPKVQEAMRTGEGVMTGPVDLVQGGRGMILRQPVFVSPTISASGTPEPWGILSVVIDYDQFITNLGIAEVQQAYDIVIREPDSDTALGQILVGNSEILDRDPIKLPFSFSFGNWELAATTDGGWPQRRPNYMQRWLLRIMAVGLLLSMLWYVMRLSQTRRLAEARLYNGIEALDHGFVMFDADGTLVLHNQRYKQMQGDDDTAKPGASYEDLLRESIYRGRVPEAIGNEDAWIAAWMRKHVENGSDTEQHLPDGKTIKTSDRRMADGSIVGLRIDVTDLKRAQTAAESANKAKTDFMGVLSHELRTPLTVILGHVRLAKHFYRAPPAVALIDAVNSHPEASADIMPKLDATFAQIGKTMETLERSGNHLLTLINEILDFAKIDSGSLSVVPVATDTDVIVGATVDQMQAMVEQKGLTFNVDAATCAVVADTKRIQQVLINLISNATKFTDEGAITLTVTAKADTVEFRVSDTGIGIPENEVARVFEAFHQVDSSATRRHGGTGLGLAISRDIAVAHGGTLTATSVEGKGSVFVLCLPRDGQTGAEPGNSIAAQ